MPESVTKTIAVEPVRIGRKRSGSTVSLLSGYRLPPDLAEKAVRRLGFIGLICAVTAPLAFLAEYSLQPERVVVSGRVPLPLASAILLFVSGLTIFGLARSRILPPAQILDLGLIYEVIGALAIALSEHAVPWSPEQPIRGISWNCLWISLFAVAIPGGYGKSVLSAVCAALMAPTGFAIATVVNRNPAPPVNHLLILFLPVFAAALWGIPVARYVHGLGASVTREREMGSYRLVERIGEGGMGEVWRGEHRMLARAAAIKLIRPESVAGKDAHYYEMLKHRFEREARATAALRSPHTVSLYDYGISEDGQFYYAMELLEGYDLEALVERYGALPPARVIFLLRQVCKSLGEAHEHGLVHRDIKPRNLFLCRLGLDYDFVKVLDFGLVKPSIRLDRTQTLLTAEGLLPGTPAYMAPEIALGNQQADPRTDIYAVGCVAYWLLTGQTVFKRDSPLSMALAHVQAVPERPSLRAAQPVPASLENLILRTLEKEAVRRPQSARELYDLLGASDGLPAWTPEDAERWWRANGLENVMKDRK